MARTSWWWRSDDAGNGVEPASGRRSTDSDRQARRSVRPGRGLVGMRERVAALGGQLRPAPARAAASGSWPASPSTTEGRCRVIRVLLADDQALVRAGSGRCWTPRRGSRWSARPPTARRRCAWPGAAARRGADGHPHARHGRPGGDQGHRRRRAPGRGPDRHPHHLRPRRVRVRGPARRGQRLPGQEHRAGRPDPRGPAVASGDALLSPG